MGLFSRALIRTTAAGTLAGLMTISGMVFGPLSQSAQADRLTATASVNLRSGPGLDYPVVGGLTSGQVITALDDSADGWTPVDLNGNRVFVASRYVTGDTTYGQQAAPTTSAGSATTTAHLNVRTGPATSYPVVTVLGKGTPVSLTGQTSGSWTAISRGGSTVWVSSVYLTTGTTTPSTGGSTPTPVPPDAGAPSTPASTDPPSPSPTPTGSTPPPTPPSSTPPKAGDTTPSAPTGSTPASTSSGSATTTTNLNVRRGPSTSYAIVTTLSRGTLVTTTGVTQDGWTQISLSGSLHWVASSYLSVISGTAVMLPAPAPVASKGTMYATATVNVRTAPSTTASIVTTLERGQQIGVTGTTSNGWTEVVLQGAQRWVSSGYLSSSQPAVAIDAVPVSYSNSTMMATALVGSSGLANTVPSIGAIVNAVESQWPVVGPYYGTRVEPGSDHNDGHAVDAMIPNWSSVTNRAIGESIALYFQANARKYNIKYIIWRQRIWSVERSSEGWRAMADRGSATQNHMDHVHLSVN